MPLDKITWDVPALKNAIIVGFNVRPDKSAIDSAARQNVDIRTHRIIYEIIEEMEEKENSMARSVKTNYLYNLIYQITAILLPLITMPYVSRVLGPQGVGTNSLTNANTQYFMLLGTLGITMYATKKIATVRENRRKLRQTFWEIFSIQFIGCMISYVIFVVILGINSSLGIYYMLQGFFILSSAIDISWYFVGIEDFKNASIRSFFVKVISLLLIFVFVKDSNDLWQYILINSLTMFVGQCVMWIYVDKRTFSAS